MNLLIRRRILFGSAGLMGAATAWLAKRGAATPIETMNATAERDRVEIIETVNKIAIRSDRRDWAIVRNCFTEQVEFDYTSLSGGEPVTITAATQVQQWADFFSSTFKTTQHLIGSHVVTLNGATAGCVAHFQAHHTYLEASQGTWLLAGTYDYDLVRTGNGWKVEKMKMTALWETGNRPF